MAGPTIDIVYKEVTENADTIQIDVEAHLDGFENGAVDAASAVWNIKSGNEVEFANVGNATDEYVAGAVERATRDAIQSDRIPDLDYKVVNWGPIFPEPESGYELLDNNGNPI